MQNRKHTYAIRSHKYLNKALTHLNSNYTTHTTERLDIIEFAQLVNNKTSQAFHNAALTGLVIFILDYLPREVALSFFKSKLPTLVTQTILPTGSKLKKNLYTILDVPSRQFISPEDQFVVLVAFYNFIRDEMFPERIPYFKTKNELLQKIENKLLTKKLLLQSEINILLRKPPKEGLLRDRFIAFPEEYVKLKGKKRYRKDLVALAIAIQERCDANDHELEKTKINYHHGKISLGFLLKYAFLLFTADEINSEWFKSEYYLLAKQILHLEDTDLNSLSALEKNFYYTHLYLEILENFPAHEAFALRIKAKLDELYPQLLCEKDPHPYLAKVKNTTQWLTDYGLKFGVFAAAAGIMEMAVSRQLLWNASGLILGTVTGAEGMLLTAKIAVVLATIVLPDAVATGVTYSLNQIRASLAEKTGQLIYLSLKLPTAVMQELSKELIQDIKPSNNPMFICSLLDAPEKIFSQKEKDKVHTLHIDLPKNLRETFEVITKEEEFIPATENNSVSMRL